MTITSYATLQSEIASWLNRDDLTSQIPTFIQFVEADVNSRLRHQKMVVRAQATSNQEWSITARFRLSVLALLLTGYS